MKSKAKRHKRKWAPSHAQVELQSSANHQEQQANITRADLPVWLHQAEVPLARIPK